MLIQGFRKSSALKRSAVQHQKESKNGRYYYKHLGTYVPPPARTLILCKRSTGRGTSRLSVGVGMAAGALGATPAAQPGPRGLLCHPRRTEDGHERGALRGLAGTAHQPCAAQSIRQHGPRESAGRWMPAPCRRPERWASAPPAGQNCRGLGMGNVLSTGHGT